MTKRIVRSPTELNSWFVRVNLASAQHTLFKRNVMYDSCESKKVCLRFDLSHEISQSEFVKHGRGSRTRITRLLSKNPVWHVRFSRFTNVLNDGKVGRPEGFREYPLALCVLIFSANRSKTRFHPVIRSGAGWVVFEKEIVHFFFFFSKWELVSDPYSLTHKTTRYIFLF